MRKLLLLLLQFSLEIRKLLLLLLWHLLKGLFLKLFLLWIDNLLLLILKCMWIIRKLILHS